LNLKECRKLTSLPDLFHLLPKLKIEGTGFFSDVVTAWVESDCCEVNGK
jgi:hypothetical protein